MHVINWKKPILKGYILCNSNNTNSGKGKTMETVKILVIRGWVVESNKEVKHSGYLGRWKWSVWCHNNGRMLLCVCVLIVQSCLTLCNPMHCSPPGFSVHDILQARILEWVAISFSRGSSQPRDWTQVSCIGGGFFTMWATREAPHVIIHSSKPIECTAARLNYNIN